MNDQHAVFEQLDGQMTIADVAPDPGNSSPDTWTDDLTDDDFTRAADAVNTVAVDLPEQDA